MRLQDWLGEVQTYTLAVTEHMCQALLLVRLRLDTIVQKYAATC